jgi:hypothetical protein
MTRKPTLEADQQFKITALPHTNYCIATHKLLHYHAQKYDNNTKV